MTSPPMIIQRLILLLLAALGSTSWAAEEALLDHLTRNWEQVGMAASTEQVPILLLVSGEDCGYCELLKREVLHPMHRDGELVHRVLVREMDLHTVGKVVDFDGEKVRAGIFLRRHKVFATPTLLFLDHAGKPLHAPLIGFNGSENYRDLLEDAIQESRVALKQGDGSAGATGN